MENLNEYHPSDQSSSGSDCEVQEFLVGGSNEGLDTARELFLQSLMVSDSEGASVYNPNNANNPYIAAAIAGGGDGPSSMGLPQLSLEKMMERDDEAPFHSLDNDTRDKLQALLQAAGIGTKLSCAHPSTIPDLTAAKALSDPTILKRLAGTGNAPGMLGLDEMMPPPNACHTMPNGMGGMPLPMPGVGDSNPLLRVQPGYEGSPADPASESSTGGERNGNIYEGSGEDGDSLLSLACVAGYYDLVQALLAMNSNVEDRGIKNDSTPLMEAAFAGHVEIVKLLLAHKAQVNAQSSTGSTALMHACSGGHEEVVRVLLDHGSSVTLHNDNGHTPLMEAASAGHVDIAKLLVEYGASLHSHSSDFKESPLTLACYKGHLDMVKYLLEMGGDPDHRADEMHTALMEASMDGHVEVARLLLDCGAEVNMPADSFESPLTLAACGGHTELAKLLLERGANIEEVNDEGYTPLMEAAREGHEEMVALLLSYNADVNAQTEETGETALTLACCSGFPDVASLLIRAGANLEQGANSPLMEAAQEGHLNCLKLLLLEGAKVNAVAVTNDTALTYAAENGHTDCCTALVDSGAFFDSAAEGGRTALMKAARAGHERTVAYLISAGADVNRTTTNNEHTALSLAAAYGFLPCVQLLLANGADPNHKLKDNSTALIEAAKGGHTAVVKLLLDFPGIQVPTNISGQLNQLCQGQFEQKMIAQLMQGDYSALEQNITVNNEIAESVVSEPFVASLYADIMQQLKTANEKAPSPVKGGVATDLDPGSRSAESAELLKRSILSLANQHEEATAGLDLGPEFGSPDGAALQNLKKTLQKKVGDLTSSEVLKLQEILKQQFHKAATVAAHQSIDSSTAQVKQPQPEELKMPVDVNRHKLAQAPEELPWDVAQAQLQQLLSKRPVIDSGLAEYAASALAPMASWNVPTSSANAGTVDNSSQSKLQADMVKLLEYASQMVDPRKAQQEFTSPSKVQQQWDVMPQLSFDPTPADPSSPSKPKPLDSVPPFGSLNVKDARLPQNLQALNLATTTTIVGGTATQERQPVAMPPPSQPGAPVTRTVAVTKGTSTTTDGTTLNNDTSSLLPTTATTQAAPTDSISRGALPIQPTPASGSDDNTVAATPAVTAVNKKNHPALDLHTESNHDTALTLACAGGHEELVTLLLNRGSNIEHKDKKGFTPLMLAATAGHSAVVEALLTANPAANIEQTSDRTKDTALSLACSGGRKEVVDVLLRKSANIEHRNVSDYTPLSLAASGGYVEIIQALIGSGAEINSRTGSKLGISPLMLAAMNGHTQAVKLLLEKGADINAQIETNRNTALTLACFQGRHEVVRLLLEYHANVEHRAKTGLTPLMEAASGGYTEVGKVLVEYGADVNAAPVPSSRDTALTIAADKGHMKFVELLVKNGSQLDVKNKKGNTPLWLAAHGGFMDVMQVMVKACAQVDAYDNRKITPLMAAFRKGHLKAVKYLVKHVSQFPSDSECMRFINTIDDKDLDARCHDCMKVIMTAKDRQAQEAAKNAKSLLQEIEQEQQLAETRRQAKQKKQEKKRQKRNAKKIVDSNMGDDFNLPNEKENLVKRAPIAVLEKEGPISGDSSDVSKCSSPEPQPAPPPVNNRVPPNTSSRVLPKKEPVDRSVSPEPVRVPAVPAVPDVTPLRSLSSTDLKTKSRKALQNSARQNTSGVKSYGMSSGAKGEKSIRQSEKAPTVQTMIFEATSHRLKVSPKSPGMMNSGIGDDGWSNARNRKSAQHKQSKLRGSGGAHQQSSSGSGTQNSSSSDNVHGAVVANKKLMQQQAKDLSIERIESRRNYRCEKIQVSSTVIARVIGRQGNNINAIRETTGAHIEVEKQARGQSHRQITLRGPNDAIKQAIAMINGLIDDQDAPVQEIIANVETTYSSASSGQGSSATQKTAAQPERAVAKRLAVGTNAAPAVANKENNSLMAQKFPNISMWSVQKAASTANRPVPTSNAQQREPTANRFPELERTTAPAQQQSEYRPFGGGFGVWGGDGSNKDPGAAKPQVRNFAAVVTKNMSSAGQAYQQQQQATVIQTTQASMTPLDVPNGPLSAASAVGPNLTAAETAGRLKPTSQQQGGGMSTTQQLGDHMTPNFSPAIVPPTRTSPQTASQDLSPHDEFGLEESKLGNASPYAGIKIYESSNQSDVARRGQTTPPPSQGNQNLITPGSVDKQSSGSSTGGYNAGGRISASPLGMINEDNRATLQHQHSQQQHQHQQQAQSTFFSAVSLPRPASATPNLERSSEWNVQDISANIANLSYNMNHAQHQQQSSSMSTSVNNHQQQQQPVSTYVPPLYSGQQRSFMSSQQQVTSHDDMRGAPPQQQQTGPIMSTGSASHTNPYDTYLNQVFHSQPPPGPPPGNVPPPPQHHFSGGHSSAGFRSNDYNQGPPPGPPMGHLQQQQFTMQPPPTISQHQQSHSQQRDFSSEWGAPSQHQQSAQQFYSPNQFMDTPFTMGQHERQTQNAFAPQQRSFTNMLGLDSDGIMNAFDPALTDFLGSASSHSGPPGAHSAFFAQPPPEPSGKGIMGAFGPPNPTGQPQGTHQQQQPNNNTWNTVLGFNRGMVGPYSGTAQGFGIPDGSSNFGTGAAMGGMNSSTYGFAQQHQQIQGLTTPQQKYLGTESNEQLWKSWQDSN